MGREDDGNHICGREVLKLDNRAGLNKISISGEVVVYVREDFLAAEGELDLCRVSVNDTADFEWQGHEGEHCRLGSMLFDLMDSCTHHRPVAKHIAYRVSDIGSSHMGITCSRSRDSDKLLLDNKDCIHGRDSLEHMLKRSWRHYRRLETRNK